MKYLLLILIVLGMFVVGCSSVFVINEAGLPVPKESILKLQEIGQSIAKENKLEVNSVVIGELLSSGVCAYVWFKDRDLGDDVYESSFQPFKVRNWPFKLDPATQTWIYPGSPKPKPIEWVKEGNMIKFKQLKALIQGREVFIRFEIELNNKMIKEYVWEFITWAQTYPKDFQDRLDKITRVRYDKDKKEITFFFDRFMMGRGYVFDISDNTFEFVCQVNWIE
jgi:hypothetical protein